MGIIEFLRFPVKNIWLFLLVLFSFYDAQLRGTPTFCRTLFIISLLGMYSYFKSSPPIIAVRKYLKFGIGVLLCCILTSLLNLVIDIWVYQHYILTQIVYLFAWFLIVKKASGKKMCLEEILHLVIFAVIINNLIAISYFFSPSLASYFLSIQEFNFNYENADYVSRLYGIGMGGTNYGGGVSSGFALILIMYLLHKRYLKVYVAMLLFVFVSFSGMLIARTTLVGICVALVGYVYYEKSVVRMFRFILPVLILSLGVIAFLIAKYKDTLLFEHTFALFINYENGDGFTDGSMETLIHKHWSILPQNVYTWLIGDGHLTYGDGYYMNTDVGYLRAIFCFGLVGTIYYWFGLFLTTFRTAIHYAKDKGLIKFLVVLFVYIIIINLKGLSDNSSNILWIVVLYVTINAKQRLYSRRYVDARI